MKAKGYNEIQLDWINSFFQHYLLLNYNLKILECNFSVFGSQLKAIPHSIKCIQIEISYGYFCGVNPSQQSYWIEHVCKCIAHLKKNTKQSVWHLAAWFWWSINRQECSLVCVQYIKKAMMNNTQQKQRISRSSGRCCLITHCLFTPSNHRDRCSYKKYQIQEQSTR